MLKNNNFITHLVFIAYKCRDILE